MDSATITAWRTGPALAWLAYREAGQRGIGTQTDLLA